MKMAFPPQAWFYRDFLRNKINSKTYHEQIESGILQTKKLWSPKRRFSREGEDKEAQSAFQCRPDHHFGNEPELFVRSDYGTDQSDHGDPEEYGIAV